MQKRWVVSAAAFALVWGVGTQARASTTIEVDIVRADWTNVVTTDDPRGPVTFYDNDGQPGNEEIRWGVPVPGSNVGRSGYRFEGAAPPSFSVPVGVSFVVGDFTHFNWPITGASLLSAQLNITANLTVEGTALAEGPFTFSFLHNETPNMPGGTDDIVSFSELMTSDTFEVDGQALTLELLGFRHGSTITTTFSTVEGRENTAQLVGIFGEPTNPVPEPGTILLLGCGLAGLAACARNRLKT